MLENSEKEVIALLMGYSSDEIDFSKFVDNLNGTQISFIRDSLAEIVRIEQLIKDAVTNAQASRVEEIDVNIEYRTSLIAAAAWEVVKISKYLKYSVRKNLYSVEDLPRQVQIPKGKE